MEKQVGQRFSYHGRKWTIVEIMPRLVGDRYGYTIIVSDDGVRDNIATESIGKECAPLL